MGRLLETHLTQEDTPVCTHTKLAFLLEKGIEVSLSHRFRRKGRTLSQGRRGLDDGRCRWPRGSFIRDFQQLEVVGHTVLSVIPAPIVGGQWSVAVWTEGGVWEVIVVHNRWPDRQGMRGGVVEHNLVLRLKNRPPSLVDGGDGDCDESP